MPFHPTHACKPVWRVAEDIELIQVPSGTFLMGSSLDEAGRFNDEGPQRWVTVPEFWMGKYPITQAHYEAVIGENPSRFKGPNRPVESVNWHEAVEFCQRLFEMTGRMYRLPSEAEWEYACRAGTTTPFYFGETISTDLANYDGNYTYGNGSKGVYREETTVVGSFPPNQFGLHDMHGNVWVWCQDNWHSNYEGARTDGSAWDEGGDPRLRVLRGGSWYDDPDLCRSAGRFRVAPDYADFFVGFRVVCSA
jgi:formylglycine-generating enzyme required for sulfatase activity